MAAKKSPRSKPKKGATKRSASVQRSAAPSQPARTIRSGFISHTEIASADPGATKAWCQDVLGWKFLEPVPTPAGPYHMWSFGNNTGGGIRAINPPETAQRLKQAGVKAIDVGGLVPGSIPYCEVPDIKAAYAKALKAGAIEMFPPDEIPGGMGWIAIVQAPGGVAIGFWGPR